MENSNTAEQAPRFYTPKEVQNILKCSRGYVYKLIANSNFPEPIYLSPRCRRWNATKVDAWCEERCNAK